MANPLVGDPVAATDPSRSHRPPSTPAELDVYDVVIGLTLTAAGRTVAGWRVGRHALRPLVGFALRPPLVPARLQPAAWLLGRARLGGAFRLRAALWLQHVLPAIVERVDLTPFVDSMPLDQIIDRIDIDRILARIDLDSIIARIDVDEIAAHLDLDVVIDRIDLAALAREVIDEIDLPEIIRESTGGMASEAVVGIRMQGIQADERVGRIVDGLLLRRDARKTQLRTSSGAGDETPD